MKLNNRTFDFNGTDAYIMGILNVTPDSFSDGGRYIHVETAISHALGMIARAMCKFPLMKNVNDS